MDSSRTKHAADGKVIFEYGNTPFGLSTRNTLERLGLRPSAPHVAYLAAGVEGVVELYRHNDAVPISEQR